LANEHGVEAFQIGEDHKLLQRRVITDIAISVRMGVSPLFGGLAEERDVEQIGLVGINEDGLGLGDGGRNEGLFDRIRVDAVVDLGQGAL